MQPIVPDHDGDESTPRYSTGLTEEVLRLAVDPTVPDASVALAYVVVPEIDRRLRMHEDSVAFLSLAQIASMVGCSRRNVLDYARRTSMAVVRKGTPWWTRNDEGKGGWATQWDLDEPVVAAKIDLRGRCRADPVLAWQWLDPRNERWEKGNLGPRAWRLILALVSIVGGLERVTVTSAIAAEILGCSRTSGHRALKALTSLVGVTETPHGTEIDMPLMVAAEASIQESTVAVSSRRAKAVETSRKKWLGVVRTLFLDPKRAAEAFAQAMISDWEDATGRPWETFLDDIHGSVQNVPG